MAAPATNPSAAPSQRRERVSCSSAAGGVTGRASGCVTGSMAGGVLHSVTVCAIALRIERTVFDEAASSDVV
jgi:hypothetical protein